MESFNTDFCNKLNRYLMEAMQHCDDPLAGSCWMDGVLMPDVESQLNKKHVNDFRRIETKAWALTNKGDINFTLTINLGKYSLRRYARGSMLDDCLAPFDCADAVRIDFDKEVIEVQLL